MMPKVDLNNLQPFLYNDYSAVGLPLWSHGPTYKDQSLDRGHSTYESYSQRATMDLVLRKYASSKTWQVQ
jgi:hypothetical protein